MKLVALCALGAIFIFSALAAKTDIERAELPLPVRKAIGNQPKGAIILRLRKERERGRVVYEVETKQNGKSRDLVFGKDGSLLEMEQEVDLNSIPVSAKQAIQKKVAGGTITKLELVTEGSSISYEAAFRTSSGKNKEVAVNSDGSARKE